MSVKIQAPESSRPQQPSEPGNGFLINASHDIAVLNHPRSHPCETLGSGPCRSPAKLPTQRLGDSQRELREAVKWTAVLPQRAEITQRQTHQVSSPPEPSPDEVGMGPLGAGGQRMRLSERADTANIGFAVPHLRKPFPRLLVGYRV